jgi:hypothetical protein
MAFFVPRHLVHRLCWVGAIIEISCGGQSLNNESTSVSSKGGGSASGTEYIASSGGAPAGLGGQSVVSSSSASTGACPEGVIPSVFARPAAITGIMVALTATHVYWNTGSTINVPADNSG